MVLAKVWSEWWAGGLVVRDKVERKWKVGTGVHGRKTCCFCLAGWVCSELITTVIVRQFMMLVMFDGV